MAGREVMRELVIGSTVGSVGLLGLVFGVQGYLNPESPLLALFADSTVAAVAIGVGLLCCMIELKILLPALKMLVAHRQPDQ